MKERYKYKYSMHILGLGFVSFNAVVMVSTNCIFKIDVLSNVLFIACILTSLFGVIINLSTYYCIREEGLRLKCITKCIDLDWKEINCIKQQPAGKLFSLSIGVFGREKKISITAWSKNYKELLRGIVKICEESDNVRIDPIVYEIINEQ